MLNMDSSVLTESLFVGLGKA